MWKKGDRVRLISTTDPYTYLKPGTMGTVGFVDDFGTVHVDWDDGSQLGMMEEVDKIEHVLDFSRVCMYCNEDIAELALSGSPLPQTIWVHSSPISVSCPTGNGKTARPADR